MKRIFISSCILALQCLSSAAAALPVPQPPSVDATSFVLLDFNSGQVLAQHDQHKRIEPASITKLMTSYIAFQELDSGHIALEDEVLISEKAWRKGGSKMFVQVGSRVKVEDLLRGIIIQSGNDASIALAEHLAGSEETFAAWMNQYAKQLGMSGTHFVNATGWPDEDHYTTAHDIALLAEALIRNFPDHYSYYSEREFTYNQIPQYNRNKLLSRDDSVDGLKTGHTESAGYCLASSAVRDGRRLISVLLGAADENSRAAGSLALLNYGFRFFETVPLYSTDETVTQLRIYKGAAEQLELGVAEELSVAIPRGERGKIEVKPMVDAPVLAPVEAGQVIGILRIEIDGELVREEPLVARNAVAQGSLWRRLVDEVILRLDL